MAHLATLSVLGRWPLTSCLTSISIGVSSSKVGLSRTFRVLLDDPVGFPGQEPHVILTHRGWWCAALTLSRAGVTGRYRRQARSSTVQADRQHCDQKKTAFDGRSTACKSVTSMSPPARACNASRSALNTAVALGSSVPASPPCAGTDAASFATTLRVVVHRSWSWSML